MGTDKRYKGGILLGPSTCDVCKRDVDIVFESVAQRELGGPYLALRLCESCEPLDLVALELDG